MPLRSPRVPRFVAALLLTWLPDGMAIGDDQPVRAYFVGNSVTDTIRYASLAKLAASRGHTLTWGRHMIPGAPLSWLWEHPKDGFQEAPFGLYPEALGEYQWNVLALQPFDRHLDGEDGDPSMAKRFIDLALRKSPEVQVYIYSRWPRRDKEKDGTLALDYRAKWLGKYTGRWDGTEETRDYFERFVAELRETYKGKARPMLLVPVGDVLLELDGRMKAGKVPCYTDIGQVYVDGIHFNNVGSYVVGMTFYATLFRDDPKGLTAGPYNEKLDPEKDRPIDEKLAAVIQEAAWEVVSKHPLAGVQPRPPVQGSRPNSPQSSRAEVLPAPIVPNRADGPLAPSIRKLGTVDLDMVEATPVVFSDHLYRFEYVRPDHRSNTTGESYFRFLDAETGKASPAFARTFDLGCAYAEGDTMWVFGVDNWDGENIVVFRSNDLEHWEQSPALKLHGWGLFNTSVCKAGDRYIMAIEVGKPPEVVGVPFTMRFAESKNLLDWTLLPGTHVYTKERYSACPALRFFDGWFYMLYLEAKPGPNYETHVVRSRDLVEWESSRLNPVLKASPEDKRIADPKLTEDQRAKIARAVDLNNSDMDLCEFQGKTIITYSWGNQQGTEFLAEAVYEGPLARFLKGFFP